MEVLQLSVDCRTLWLLQIPAPSSKGPGLDVFGLRFSLLETSKPFCTGVDPVSEHIQQLLCVAKARKEIVIRDRQVAVMDFYRIQDRRNRIENVRHAFCGRQGQ